MSRKLVAYFSASGITAKVAENLAEAVGADLFEIAPAVRYTNDDLDWRNENSRSSIEMKDPASRPAVEAIRDNMDEYDVIFVGFPIWWYIAPTIINTFLEQYDLAGKLVKSYFRFYSSVQYCNNAENNYSRLKPSFRLPRPAAAEWAKRTKH